MWEQIRSNQIRSIVLVAGMGIVLLGLGYALGMLFANSAVVGLVIALLLWGIMSLVAFFQGDSIILGVAKARKISREDHPRLYNVVEEMKISSGLEKMPDVYIIDDPALNAFATGRDIQHASVAITSGLLAKLNRDELQGVIAHEIGHIKNRDIRLMTLASVLMGSIIILAWYGTRVLFFSSMSGGNRRRSSNDSGGGGAQIIILVIGLVLMILAPIMAQILYFSLSRKREYLADASSALYTRYPEGLASALEKLQNNNTQVQNANKATAPLYISNPFYKKGMAVNDLFATHPPLSDRIKILRKMSGAGYAEYEKSYETLKNARVMGTASLTGEAVQLRQATTGAADGELQDQVSRTRETSEAMWKFNNYRTITCRNCSTILRLPPSFQEPTVRCPHCGHINPAV